MSIINKIEQSIVNERYELAVDFAKLALCSPECQFETDNAILVYGYMLFCYTELEWFKEAAKTSDKIHDLLTTKYDFPPGSNSNKPEIPDSTLAFTSTFAAGFCLGMGDTVRATRFLDNAVIFNNKVKNRWLDGIILVLIVRLIGCTIDYDKRALERAYEQGTNN